MAPKKATPPPTFIAPVEQAGDATTVKEAVTGNTSDWFAGEDDSAATTTVLVRGGVDIETSTPDEIKEMVNRSRNLYDPKHPQANRRRRRMVSEDALAIVAKLMRRYAYGHNFSMRVFKDPVDPLMFVYSIGPRKPRPEVPPVPAPVEGVSEESSVRIETDQEAASSSTPGLTTE